MTNFSWSIPQTTLTASGYSVNLNVDRELYLTIANLGPTYGGGDVTISVSWQDSSGAGQTATVIAGSSFGPSLITVRTFSVSGAGALIIGTLSSSKVSPESLLASAVNVSGTVKTDVGQGEQASNNTTLNFGGTPIDPRDRTWTLGGGDTPSRSWSLGSGDTPGRSWTLGASDVPGRGWTLGSTDTPGRSWTLGSGDTPVPWSSVNKPFNADPSGNLEHVSVLPGTTTPVWNSQVKQDSVGNIQHVPVLQGTSTPIHTKVLQYGFIV